MCAGTWRCSILVGAMLAVIGPSLSATADSGDDKARAIADQFAKGKAPTSPAGARRVTPAQAPSAADEQRMIEEVDMLARARAEAEARREDLLKLQEARERGETRPDGATGGKPTADEQRAVEAAAREAEARLRDQERRAEERRNAEAAAREAAAQRKAEDERRMADERRQAEASAKEAEARRKKDEDDQVAAMEAEREAEAARISEALRRAREARLSSPATGAEATTTAGTGRVGEPGLSGYAPDAPDGRRRWDAVERDRGDDRRSSEDLRRTTRVAVLLLMTPGTYGIRRHNRTADPLLCGEEGCYVSAGPDHPAELLRRRRAFGVGRTLGSRAGACSNSLGCIFRGIELNGYPAIVQPVDMHVLRHDRRQPQVLHETSDCRADGRLLSCATTIRGPDYAMWIVPEAIADEVGPQALEHALEFGLPEARWR